MQAVGQAQNSHNLGGNSNIEAILTRHTMSLTAQANHDIAQLAVIHINYALPHDAARVDIQSIALLDMIIQHRAKQHVRAGNSVEVTSEVQVDVLHGHYLGVTATSGAALNTHAGAQGGLAQSNDNLFADFVQALGQANSGSGFAFTSRSRRNGGNQHQFARLLVFHAANQIHG